MRLTVLGCSGTFPGPDSPCSGYLLEHDGFRIVLDFGSGVLGQLQRHGGLLELDAIYVSHLHGDHCLDLIPYSYARRYHPDGTPERLPVYGPHGTWKRMFEAYENAPEDGLLDVYDFREVAPGAMQIGPFAVEVAEMNHPVESHGLRFTAGGRTFVYSADTAVSDALVHLARGADLFLCEASFLDSLDNPPGVHLTGSEAGETATEAGASRLLLTHVPPWHDRLTVLAEARTTYAGDVALALPGETYTV